MINRLKSIKLDSFRAFAKDIDVPLDSGIVLLYGPNGSGKSSILHGIETALTGNASDLLAFGSDYPRSLINYGSKIAEVKLDVVLNEKETPISIDISDKVQSNTHLSNDDIHSFLNRSYLSQSKLQRILDLYSTFEEDGLGGVGFLKEFFGSKLLDDLIEGLNTFSNKRSVGKSVDVFFKIDKNIDEVRTQLSQINSKIRSLEVDSLENFSKSNGMLATFFPDSQIKLSEQTPQSVESCIEQVENVSPDAHPDTQLTKFKKLSSQLSNTLEFLADSGGESELKEIDQLNRRINELEKETLTISIPLGRAVEHIEALCEQIKIYPYQHDKPDRLDKKSRVLFDYITSHRSMVQGSMNQLIVLKQNLKAVNDETKAMQTELEKLREKTNKVDSFRLLNIISQLMHSHDTENCPVCDRDFSETGSGTLKSHVDAKLAKIGVNIEEHNKVSSRNIELTREIEIYKSRSEEIERQIKSFHLPDSINETLEVLNKAKVLVDESCELIPAFERIYSELVKLKTQRSMSESKLKQYSKKIDEIFDIAESIDVDIGTKENSKDGFWEPLRESLDRLVEEAERRSELLRRLTFTLRETLSTAKKLEELKDTQIKATVRLQAFEKAQKSAETSIKSYRSIRRSAIESKEEIYKKIFSDTLNSLYSNIFKRLVSTERFTPAITVPYLDRGKLMSGVNAMMGSTRAFDNVKSVLSTGNINTAALSLFLTLNLMEKGPHQVLVLDDPVQSMDDVKVSQMARTLRQINMKFDRQILLAIHERPLFDNLKQELSPKSDKESLLWVELFSDGKNHELESKHVYYEEDDVGHKETRA